MTSLSLPAADLSLLALPVPFAPGLSKGFPGPVRGAGPGSAFSSRRGGPRAPSGSRPRSSGLRELAGPRLCPAPHARRARRALPEGRTDPGRAGRPHCRHLKAPASHPAPGEAVPGRCSALRRPPLPAHAWEQRQFCLRSRFEGEWRTGD